MSNSSLIGSCEVTINYAVKMLPLLEGKNKKAFENEFKEQLETLKAIIKTTMFRLSIKLANYLNFQARGCKSGYLVL